MKTKITEMLNIEHPIIQGGMHYVGFAELAAAVSNAGGLGTITGLTQKTPEDLANEISKCNDMTEKPFAVNLTFSLRWGNLRNMLPAIILGGIFSALISGIILTLNQDDEESSFSNSIAALYPL